MRSDCICASSFQLPNIFWPFQIRNRPDVQSAWPQRCQLAIATMSTDTNTKTASNTSSRDGLAPKRTRVALIQSEQGWPCSKTNKGGPAPKRTRVALLGGARGRERDSETEAVRQAHALTDRQTDRQTGPQADTRTEKERDRHRQPAS